LMRGTPRWFPRDRLSPHPWHTCSPLPDTLPCTTGNSCPHDKLVIDYYKGASMHIIRTIAKKPLAIMAIILALTATSIVAIAQNAQLVTDFNECLPSDARAVAFSVEAVTLLAIDGMILMAIEYRELISNAGTLT